MEDFEQKFMAHAREFGDFLSDIRRRLLLCAAVFAAAFAVGFFFSSSLISSLVEMLALEHVQYVITSPFQLISMSMDMGLFIGVAAVFPLVLVELFDFMRPALSKSERAVITSYVLMSLVLFVTGFAYGLAVMYYATWVVASVNSGIGLLNMWDISLFLSQMLLTSALLGVLFQFPLVISGLIRFGVSTRAAIASKRRFVIAFIVILVAFLPPTDGLSLLVMAVPLVALYELSLLLARIGKRADTALLHPTLGLLRN